MKKILLTTILSIFFILFTITESNSLLSQSHYFNYQTFGLYSSGVYGITGGVKKFDLYSLNVKANSGYRYRYEIYLMSRTQANYGYRDVNAYGMHVFVDNNNVTIAQYPYGLNGLITVDRTLIYVWETNNPSPNFNVTWQNIK